MGRLSSAVKTTYTSLPVNVPKSFLRPLSDSSTITVTPIDFAESSLPEYRGLHAVILDNVLTPEECNKLIHLAETSAGGHQGGETQDGEGDGIVDNGWKPALVGIGNGYEILEVDYRDSDRIIWDHEDVARRLFMRVLQAEGIKDYLMTLHGENYADVIGDPESVWVTTAEKGLNERMRFLRYDVGQFFAPHCDCPRTTPDGLRHTLFTLHLYLNDSVQALDVEELTKRVTERPRRIGPDGKPEGELLRGGATTFFSRDMQRRLDVDPKAGRVLIFQQSRLYHSGDYVRAGVKYTMRSEILYEQKWPESEDGTGGDEKGKRDLKEGEELTKSGQALSSQDDGNLIFQGWED